jgi:hypothetical protein
VFVLRAGDDTERLVWGLQRELAEEVQIHAPELPRVIDTPISIKFRAGPRRVDAALRIRGVLEGTRSDWP